MGWSEADYEKALENAPDAENNTFSNLTEIKTNGTDLSVFPKSSHAEEPLAEDFPSETVLNTPLPNTSDTGIDHSHPVNDVIIDNEPNAEAFQATRQRHIIWSDEDTPLSFRQDLVRRKVRYNLLNRPVARRDSDSIIWND